VELWEPAEDRPSAGALPTKLAAQEEADEFPCCTLLHFISSLSAASYGRWVRRLPALHDTTLIEQKGRKNKEKQEMAVHESEKACRCGRREIVYKYTPTYYTPGNDRDYYFVVGARGRRVKPYATCPCFSRISWPR